MKEVTARHEVVVLGGGPAGCAAATMLVKRGHDVAIVRPTVPPAGALVQSIPPSANRILVELDMLSELERSGCQPNGGNTVWWAEKEVRVETFESGRTGFHVDRAGLEQIMGTAARTAGVHVYEATARAVAESDPGWVVRSRTQAGAVFELQAPWVLDATGRRGIVARREGRRHEHATATLALVRRWRREGGFPSVEPTHTLVQSFRSGWVWSVPLGPEVRCFTAMVDQRHTDLSGSNLNAALDAELDKAPRVSSSRAGATPMGPAWACSASLYTAARFGRSGLLLLGDAGSFIDPLSSFGVKKALSSGWLAAIAVHTALVDSSMTDTAVRFFDEREREVYRRYRARSADFFEACADAYGHTYWTSRARAARAAGSGTTASREPDVLEEEGVPANEARDALERLRARSSLDAVRGASVRTVERPTVVGHRIVLAQHLASDRVPAGLRYVRNVDLARLVEVAPRHPGVPDAWEAYNQIAPAVALPDYLAALATAFAAGLLEHSRG